MRFQTKVIDLSLAPLHNINYFKDDKKSINDCKLIGGRGYLSTEIQLNVI